MYELSESQIFIASGLLISIIGSGILVWRTVKMHFASLFSNEVKKKLKMKQFRYHIADLVQ